MNTPPRRHHPAAPVLPLLLGAALLLAFAGCYTAGPGYVSRPQPAVVVVDTYVYYPGYEVYYNNARRQYVYRDGNVWVTRRDPPRTWAHDLPRAPSVHVDFHDAPERHHADVVRTYPRNWKQPPPASPHRDQHKGDKDHRDHDSRQ